MTLTNSSIMFTAFIISMVSVVIVFVAGIMSGVVRLGTVMMRSLLAFFMSGAASYFLLMVFDWYYERQHKKFSTEQINVESQSAEGNAAATPTPANPPPQT